MNNKLIEKEIQNTETKAESAKKRKSSDEDQYRIVISKEVNDALELAVSKTNADFHGVSVDKSDVGNYLLANATKVFTDSDVKALRYLHFDEKKILRSLLRNAGDDSELPEHLKKAIREHYGITEASKKRSSKTTNEISTEKNVDI